MLFGFKVLGDDIISFETDRRIEVVGVSERVHGIDPWVFVLLNEDVEPPVDVDCRSKFDVIGEMFVPNDERRFVESGGLGRAFVVDGKTMGTIRWVRGWAVVVIVSFVEGAVVGRIFNKLTFPLGTETVVIGCLGRVGAIRGTEG